jgi:hypothetical protein
VIPGASTEPSTSWRAAAQERTASPADGEEPDGAEVYEHQSRSLAVAQGVVVELISWSVKTWPYGHG